MIQSSGKETERDIDVCPYCQNSGYELFVDEDGLEYARKCRCGILDRMLHDRRLRFADIPEAFKDVRLSNFKKSAYQDQESKKIVTEASHAIMYWLENLETMQEKGIGLSLYSYTKGSGKTRLIVSISNELIEKHSVQVKFCTSVRILDEIRKTWDRNRQVEEETESQLLYALMNVDVLVIDDFGAEQTRGWVNEKFYSIINERYIARKITLFTSNSRMEDLQYDERIISRIKERVLQIPMPEESVRDAIAEQNRKGMAEYVKKKINDGQRYSSCD